MTSPYPILLVLPLLAWYLYNRLRWLRFEQYKSLPRFQPDLVWGHMKVVGEAMGQLEKGVHADYAFDKLHKALGSPGVLTVDMRPVSHVLCIIFSHRVAEQLTRPSKTFRYSVYKSPTMRNLDPVIGHSSILRAEGEQWKALRRRFNPGFAPNHLISLLPQIISKTRIFLSHLDRLAASGEVFKLDELAVNLTFDIIGTVVLDMDFNAQESSATSSTSLSAVILTNYRALLAYYDDNTSVSKLDFLRGKRRRAQGDKINRLLVQAIGQKFSELQRSRDASKSTDLPSPNGAKGKSVLALSLNEVDTLTPDIANQTADQLKTFLLAGHDTTAILLQWALYMLSIHPSALAKLTAELDAVLGPESATDTDTDAASVILARGDAVLSRLTYLSAVIKEILRLFPPAASARMAPRGSGCALTLDDGRRVVVDGCVLYICHYGLHRDRKVFGEDADAFRPERWLGDVDTSMDTNDAGDEAVGADDGGGGDEEDVAGGGRAEEKRIPASAWRPFERGPRNCIGQELANIEARVILACVVRKYAFEKVGAGQRLVGGKLVGEELVNRRQITSKPIDGMEMKVRLAKV